MSWEKSVFSSNVATVGYDDEIQEMVVTFKNGRVYAYEGVDEGTALNVANAPSVGAALNQQVKGQYQHRQIR